MNVILDNRKDSSWLALSIHHLRKPSTAANQRCSRLGTVKFLSNLY